MIEKISESTFGELVLSSSVPVLVDFYQDHCLPCKKLEPELEKAAEQLGGAVRVYSVKFQDDFQLTLEYGVSSFPTMVLFEGGKVIKRIIGPRTCEDIVGLF